MNITLNPDIPVVQQLISMTPEERTQFVTKTLEEYSLSHPIAHQSFAIPRADYHEEHQLPLVEGFQGYDDTKTQADLS